MSPKHELILTLEAAWHHLTKSDDPAMVRLAQLRGLVDHARALALRVGEMAKPRGTGKRDQLPEEEIPL